MRIVTKPKKWGNSLGIVIPSEVVKNQKITPETEIHVDIEKPEPLKDLFGKLSGWDVDVQATRDKNRKQELRAQKRKWDENTS